MWGCLSGSLAARQVESCARRRVWLSSPCDAAVHCENRFEKFEPGRAGRPAQVGLLQAWLDETNVAVHGVQVSCHACPAHEHPACSQPACIDHMMIRWQVLLHSCGEAAYGSATPGVLHVPASMPPHRCCSSCTLLTACALPGITGDDGLERSGVCSHRADGAAGVWQVLALSAPRLGSRLWCIVCETCLCADCQACFLALSWAQTAVCGAVLASVGLPAR